jgi:hypothetical protein
VLSASPLLQALKNDILVGRPCHLTPPGMVEDIDPSRAIQLLIRKWKPGKPPQWTCFKPMHLLEELCGGHYDGHLPGGVQLLLQRVASGLNLLSILDCSIGDSSHASH